MLVLQALGHEKAHTTTAPSPPSLGPGIQLVLHKCVSGENRGETC